MISLKICFMAWLYEFIAVVFTSLSPLLRDHGSQFLHYPDALVMFVIIPFIHLMNHEDIKTIIIEENWIQGMRYMMGTYSPTPAQLPQRKAVEEAVQR